MRALSLSLFACVALGACTGTSAARPTDDGGVADARSPADAAPGVDAGPPPVECLGATQPCDAGGAAACCDDLVCGSTMLGAVCCGNPGATCTTSADCCGDIPCTGDRCTPMCHRAAEPCTGAECCSGLSCAATSGGMACAYDRLHDCGSTAECASPYVCGHTTAGQVCCGNSGAYCNTPEGSDCCGSLLCTGNQCR